VSTALPGYEAARSRAASIELDDRGVLAVSGPLRQKFLHNLLSNDVQSLQPGQGRLAALMDVKGHLQALMRVLAAEDTVLLELPKARLAALEATFVHYRVGTPVRFAARPTRVFGGLGPESQALLASLGLEAPAGDDSHALRRLGEHDVRVVRASDLPGPGFVLHAEPEAVPALVEALRAADVAELGRDSLDALRIESGRPWYGPDVTSDNLLHETGLLAQYHSSSKGCYIGQEVVARLEGRGGNVSRKLRGIRLSAPAAAGVALSAEGHEVGRITSYALSPRLGPIALAYVHRAHSEPGTAVEVGGAAAAVVALPFADPTAEGAPQP
jgi:folate-binding protein YgfZ